MRGQKTCCVICEFSQALTHAQTHTQTHARTHAQTRKCTLAIAQAHTQITPSSTHARAHTPRGAGCCEAGSAHSCPTEATAQVCACTVEGQAHTCRCRLSYPAGPLLAARADAQASSTHHWSSRVPVACTSVRPRRPAAHTGHRYLLIDP